MPSEATLVPTTDSAHFLRIYQNFIKQAAVDAPDRAWSAHNLRAVAEEMLPAGCKHRRLQPLLRALITLEEWLRASGSTSGTGR